jgi:putative oxidoreductase
MNNSDHINTAQVLLRVTFGVLLLAHGLLKVLGFGVEGTVGFFASLGLPAIVAYLVMAGEVLGGVALIVGYRVRTVALLSLPIMLGAVWVHASKGWLFSNAGGGWEFPVLLVVLAVVLALQGGGTCPISRHFQK